MEKVTLSVEELKQLINEEVNKALENNKPVKSKEMKALEQYFKEETYRNELAFNWYGAWNAVRMSIALKMGFTNTTKVPASKYDEFLSLIKKDIDVILEMHKYGKTRS